MQNRGWVAEVVGSERVELGLELERLGGWGLVRDWFRVVRNYWLFGNWFIFDLFLNFNNELSFIFGLS